MEKKYKSIYHQLRQYKYISVDIYDTLLKRFVKSPDDIYKIVGEETNLKSFYHKRLVAERIARKFTIKEDITIDDIYRKYFGRRRLFLRDLEKNVEIKLVYPNSNLVDIINKLKMEGHYIIVTTDMYLDRDTIDRLLSKINLMYDYIFISGECGVSKRKGGLYQFLLADLNISADMIIHIGNDEISDIFNANCYGITSCRITDEDFYDVVEASKGAEEVSNIALGEAFQYIGFYVLGPFLCSFCEWIHSKLEKDDVIWFMSREGYLIKKVYDKLYPEDGKNVRYISINKNVLRCPQIFYDESLEAFLKSIPAKKFISLENVISYFELNTGKKFCCNNIKSDIHRRYKMSEFVNEKVINEDYKTIISFYNDQIMKQHNLLINYINKNCDGYKRVLLVNNSINGNCQEMIERFTSISNMNVSFLGLQFIESMACKKKNMNIMSWFSESGISKYYYESFDRNCLFLEQLLFETVGTAIYLEEIEGEIEVITKRLNLEKNNEESKRILHERVLDYVDKYVNYYELSYDLQKKHIEAFFEFMENPEKKYIDSVGDLYDDDDIDDSKPMVSYSPKGGSIFDFRVGFRNSLWKYGYLKRYMGNKWAGQVYKLWLYIKSTYKRKY